MFRSWVAAFSLCMACHQTPVRSGGPPAPGPIPSRTCDGRAPLDEAIADLPGVRASWFNAPSGNERLYVLEAGDARAPTLLLIHGVGMAGTADFYPVLRLLGRTHHVLAVDLPGFGRSDPKDDDYGPERLVAAIDTVTRVCAPRRFDVLGHSSGGALALLFAAEHPDSVRRLMLVDVAGVLRPEVLLRGQLYHVMTPARDKAPIVGKAVEKMGGLMIDAVQALVPSAKSVGESGLLGNSPPVRAGTALLDYNFGPAIAGVRAPTRIFWGEEDRVMPPRIAHLLDARIARSDLVFLPGAGHVPMQDTPELLARSVVDYLSDEAALPRKVEETENRATRDGRCDGEADQTFSGDYDEIAIHECTHVRLHRARARRVTIRKSEGRIDESIIEDGLVVDDTDLSLTGGSLRGTIALDVSDSQLDIAGVAITGTESAVRVRKDSDLVLSVSPVESPHTHEIMHRSLELEEGQQL